jgi:hypothetical protein
MKVDEKEDLGTCGAKPWKLLPCGRGVDSNRQGPQDEPVQREERPRDIYIQQHQSRLVPILINDSVLVHSTFSKVRVSTTTSLLDMC